jgi:hypothetical protein
MKTRFATGLSIAFALAVFAPLSLEKVHADDSAVVPPKPPYAGYPNYSTRYPRFLGISKKQGYGIYTRSPQYYSGYTGPESQYRPYQATGGYYFPRYYYKSHVGKFGYPYIHVGYAPLSGPVAYEHHYHHDERRFLR